MRIVVLRSVDAGTGEASGTEYVQRFDTVYARRVLGNLVGEPGFCTACADDCVACRQPYRRCYRDSIKAVVDFPAALPYLLEKPETYVPSDLPQHDVLLAICIHEQILIEILKVCSQWGTSGVVAPIEAPDWISPAARRKASAVCERQNTEISFPRPFCAFRPPAGGVLAEFRESFHIGAPEVALTFDGDTIAGAEVRIGAACGATHYIARWLRGRRTDDDIKYDVIARRLHSYPCTASMEWDDEVGETLLHVSGEEHYRILASLPSSVTADERFVRSPLGMVIPRPVPVQENLKNVETVKQSILAELEKTGRLSLDALPAAKGATPAAQNTALLMLKQEGKIAIHHRTIRKPPARAT